MRTEQNRDGTYNDWISREEYQVLPRETTEWEHEIAIRLMGDCGLRRTEVLDVQPRHISRRSDGTHHALDVGGGKDTTGEHVDGKYRETWLPVELERDVNRYVQHQDLDRDGPLIDRSKRTPLY